MNHAITGGSEWGAAGRAALWLAAAAMATAGGVAAPAQPPQEAPLQPAAAPAPQPVQGRLIRITLPVTGAADQRIKGTIERAIAQFAPSQERPILVLEFVPGATEFGAGKATFERALSLAKYLCQRDLASVRTVAYIPKTIRGHGVLAAIACEEIIMAPGAELGPAGVDEPADEPLDPTVQSGYSYIAQLRRPAFSSLIMGMLDKRVEVLRVETEVSTELVDQEGLDALKQRSTVLSTQVLKPKGELGRVSGRLGRELGMVKYLAPDRESVAAALGLPLEALREDPSLAGDWSPVRIDLDGPVEPQKISMLQSMVADQVHDGRTNFILLHLDSEGGSLEDSMNLANLLAELDSNVVRTVAYIPVQAKADAALIAMACDQVVMQPGAVLGGVAVDAGPVDPEEARQNADVVRGFAREKSKSWSLIAALVDPNLAVYRYVNKNSGAIRYFCEDELQSMPAEQVDAWVQGPRVTIPGQVLSVTGDRAKELGLAWEVVNDLEQLKSIYGLEDDPRLIEPDWVDVLVKALSARGVRILLLIIAIAAGYAELQAPGIGVGGFISALAFLLFFWSNYLNATVGWLEVLLFLGGVCCLLLEIFVLPGFGIFGLGGGLMVIASLVLASQKFVLPSSSAEMNQMRDSIVVVGAALVGTLLVIGVLRRMLPRTPGLNRLLLQPPAGEEIARRESLVDFRNLVGKRGVAQTQLTPSGKALIDERLVDVIADGEVIDRDSEIEVMEVKGNRVLVRLSHGR